MNQGLLKKLDEKKKELDNRELRNLKINNPAGVSRLMSKPPKKGTARFIHQNARGKKLKKLTAKDPQANS